MRKRILERYRCNSEGRRVIDIAAARVADLYDDFDKQAPFIKKDLDYDFVEYLVESAQELGREPFSINFSFTQELDDALEERVRKSIHGYLDYLLARNVGELHGMFRTSLTLFALGMVILSASFYVSHVVSQSSVAGMIVMEGLVIAASFSMWEAIAGVVLSWQPIVRERLVYRRLKNAELTFVRGL